MPKTQPSRTTDESPTVRPDIIAAATKVFSELGYHGASMTDVAAELGMRKPSLYHHVRRKEDLLFAIHEQMVDELIAETMVVFSSAQPPSEKLRDIVRNAMDFVGRHQDGVTVFLAEHRSLRGDRWNEIVVKRDFYERMVQGIIADGTASGAFVDMPPTIAAKAVLAMANWGYTWFQAAGPMSAGEIGEMFAEIALRGLEVRPD
jgi:AcrR family transcriptional regulator